MAALGKLHRIAHEIHHNLPITLRVTADCVAVWVSCTDDLYASCLRRWCEQGSNILGDCSWDEYFASIRLGLEYAINEAK